MKHHRVPPCGPTRDTLNATQKAVATLTWLSTEECLATKLLSSFKSLLSRIRRLNSLTQNARLPCMLLSASWFLCIWFCFSFSIHMAHETASDAATKDGRTEGGGRGRGGGSGRRGGRGGRGGGRKGAGTISYPLPCSLPLSLPLSRVGGGGSEAKNANDEGAR